jgi:hypothetical protein
MESDTDQGKAGNEVASSGCIAVIFNVVAFVIESALVIAAVSSFFFAAFFKEVTGGSQDTISLGGFGLTFLFLAVATEALRRLFGWAFRV